MAGGGIKISNIKVNGGADGATFIPSVSSDGVLSWTNNKGYANPVSVNIKGADGAAGKDGKNGANIVSTVLQGQDANGGNIYKQTFDNGVTAYFTAPKGATGATGAKGDKGDSGNPSGNILQETGTSTEDTMSQNAITEALKTWLQRQNAEEDLNALSNVENGKAFISRYIATTANTPSNYGNVISLRNSSGELTQLAMDVQSGKAFYRASQTATDFGTWKEVDTIAQKGWNYIVYTSGLKIQWGETLTPSDIEPQETITQTITIPITMTTGVYHISVTSANSRANLSVDNITTSDFVLWIRNMSPEAIAAGSTFSWMVIGY